ncbi:hypothetical protein SDC9_105241 [bioreactor metagenome]|uniref:Uncharacterized protein n=1 Tax=bioreactor metagenome TaxID=1076179 RepID=A0A645AZ05_9ZZZZ
MVAIQFNALLGETLNKPMTIPSANAITMDAKVIRIVLPKPSINVFQFSWISPKKEVLLASVSEPR